MRPLMNRLKRLWNTPVEFYGIDCPEPQAGPWHGLVLFVILLLVLGLLWLIRYIPERTYLVYVVQRPNGAMLRQHLGDMHPVQVRPYLTRMEPEVYKVVEGGEMS